MEQIKEKKLENSIEPNIDNIANITLDKGFEPNIEISQNLEKARKDIENSKEIIEKEYENIKTMADFIEYLEHKLEATTDLEEKKAIAISLLRIKNAFVGLKIKPDKINIGITTEGKWTVYNKNAGEFRASEELLESIEDCQMSTKEMNVSFREAVLEEKGISDVGLQQLQIEKLGINPGEYHKEDRSIVKRIFGKWGEKNVLELAMDPKELADYFLEKEVEKRLRLGKKIKASDLAPYLAEQFKKAAPKAYKRLISKGYVFRARVQEIISKTDNK